MNGAGIRAAFSYCVQQVRTYDYHNYLCILELPPALRKAAFAFRSFNIETARAMDVSSDLRTGLLRLLWWEEAIDKIFSKKLIEHPTAQALSSVIADQKVSKLWLKRSVEARLDYAKREHGDNPPQTIDELEKYAEDTASTILYMTLQAGGIKSTVADHAASHVGKASGLLLLLKSLPYHVNGDHHFAYIPSDLAAKHDLIANPVGTQSGITSPESRQRLCNAVFEIASVANLHLIKARELAAKVPVEAHEVLLPAVPAQVLLDSLNRVNFDVYDPRLSQGILGIPPLWYQLKIKWHSWKGKY